jgi:hypothetical protein
MWQSIIRGKVQYVAKQNMRRFPALPGLQSEAGDLQYSHRVIAWLGQSAQHTACQTVIEMVRLPRDVLQRDPLPDVERDGREGIIDC